MNSPSSPTSAIVTVAFGFSTEHLDYTFSSFALNANVPLHAFVIGGALPKRRLENVTYHLVTPQNDFSHPLREVYFRRMELLDTLNVDFALVVDSYDVLCLRPLPAFGSLLAGGDVAACVEHMGARYLMGQGYTPHFLNGGVFFWNVPRSQDMRAEIVARGRRHFRTIADDQYAINEVIQSRYFERLRILPCQYNYRAYLNRRQRGWPTVTHLDGIFVYHNATCMDEAKSLGPWKAKAELPPLPNDGGPLTPSQQFWRRVRLRLQPHVIK
jgi:hypothetical protein